MTVNRYADQTKARNRDEVRSDVRRVLGVENAINETNESDGSSTRTRWYTLETNRSFWRYVRTYTRVWYKCACRNWKNARTRRDYSVPRARILYYNSSPSWPILKVLPPPPPRSHAERVFRVPWRQAALRCRSELFGLYARRAQRGRSPRPAAVRHRHRRLRYRATAAAAVDVVVVVVVVAVVVPFCACVSRRCCARVSVCICARVFSTVERARVRKSKNKTRLPARIAVCVFRRFPSPSEHHSVVRAPEIHAPSSYVTVPYAYTSSSSSSSSSVRGPRARARSPV